MKDLENFVPHGSSKSVGCGWLFLMLFITAYLLPIAIITIPATILIYLILKKNYAEIKFAKVYIATILTALFFYLLATVIPYALLWLLQKNIDEAENSLTIYWLLIIFIIILILDTLLAGKIFQKLLNINIKYSKAYALSFLIYAISILFSVLLFVIFWYSYLRYEFPAEDVKKLLEFIYKNVV